MDPIKVFGRDWCEDTQRTLHHLEALGVPFRYINTDLDPQAEEWVAEQNGGKVLTPTVNIDGEIVAEPADAKLDEILRRHYS